MTRTYTTQQVQIIRRKKAAVGQGASKPRASNDNPRPANIEGTVKEVLNLTRKADNTPFAVVKVFYKSTTKPIDVIVSALPEGIVAGAKVIAKGVFKKRPWTGADQTTRFSVYVAADQMALAAAA